MTEPFIVPALYEEYTGNTTGAAVVDEWTLSLAMGSDLARRMEQHYKTFIVRFLLFYKDCLLFTYAFLEDGTRLCRDCGFVF